jgi:hypothetical protein
VRILLDECIDRNLAPELTGHTVKTVPQMRWGGIKNGRLLALAAKESDVFLTVDRALSAQQHLPQFNIAVLVLAVPGNRLADMLPLVPEVLALIPSLKTGEATTVGTWKQA